MPDARSALGARPGLFLVMFVYLCGGSLAAFVVQAAAIAPPKVVATAPLHDEIDRLLESQRLAPAGAPADDAEFLRRVMLDLHGIVPTADEARAFLDDRSAGKRAKLIDQLLASPRFARHMATTFDVMWNERLADKVIKAADWYEFLYQSFARNKPYDQLVREVLLADDANAELKPASKFFYDRDCEPNTMTRDIGRIFFGMDMQCNQCHDHPLVDDYKIGDYYGLYAFVSRTYLHNDKKTKAKVIAEKADGEASFKSVFTGEAADKVSPRLPRGATVADPAIAKGEEYVVKPDKGEKPVPKFSRRAKLAEAATDGKNEMFNRNAVNRLWAHLFGRGLVHPVDFMHPDNPPTHPEVLDLLAREFHNHKYDIRWLLRELVLTRAYQRSFVPPTPAALKVGQASKRLAAWEAEQTKLAAELKQAEAAAAKSPDAQPQVRKLRTLVHALAARIEEAKQIVAYEKIAKSDPAAGKRAWEALVQRWTDRGDIAQLKPLSPEAFAASMMQVTGIVAVNEAKAKASLKKATPKELVKVDAADRPRMESMWLDKQTFEPLRGNYGRFIELYGDIPGGDFGATLNQALFFGNGGVVEGWLKPSGENLSARLQREKEAGGLAEEMYLAVFTRRPTDVERADVAGYLKGRDADRALAVQEMLWALLSSNEFRFNH